MARQIICFKQARQRFLQQGRNDIELCLIGYKGWKIKSQFYDKITKNYFWARPYDVYKHRSVHPDRRKIKRKQTCVEKYNVEHVMFLSNVKEKIRQTNLKKYGVEHVLLNKKIKEKRNSTMLVRHSVVHPLKSEIIKNKMKQTCIKRFGVENVMDVKEIKIKLEQTNLKKYGVEHVLLNKIIFDKVKQIKIDKQQIKNIVETKQTLSEWLKEQPCPKPSYLTFSLGFKELNISLKKAIQFLEEWKNNKSSLEMIGEQIFNTTHYNKKPKVLKLQKTYKPDFKISDKIYVNVDGLYWHSNKIQNDDKYHFNMRKLFEENGLRLFQFYSNEIKNKPEICKSLVNNVINNTKKIGIEQYIISNVNYNTAADFLNKNHLKGYVIAKHIGLYCKDKLISVLSYKHRNNTCKIERYCSLIDYNIIDGFSKLLLYLEKYCLKQETTEIHSLIDLRYDTGNHLLNEGFVHKKDVLEWRWTDCNTTFHKTIKNNNKSKYYKIYDAGQRLYIKKL